MRLYLFAKDDLVLSGLYSLITDRMQEHKLSLLSSLPMLVSLSHVALSQSEQEMCEDTIVTKCEAQGRILILHLNSDKADRDSLKAFLSALLAITDCSTITGFSIS